MEIGTEFIQTSSREIFTCVQALPVDSVWEGYLITVPLYVLQSQDGLKALVTKESATSDVRFRKAVRRNVFQHIESGEKYIHVLTQRDPISQVLEHDLVDEEGQHISVPENEFRQDYEEAGTIMA